jgi:hypothetical protein
LAFSRQEKLELQTYEFGCNLIASHVIRAQSVTADQVRKMASAVDGEVPHSDDYGYPLATQAQAGMLALICGLEDWLNDEPPSAGEAAGAVVDALDNYEYGIRRYIEGKKSAGDEYPLLDREITWQTRVIDRIAAANTDEKLQVVAVELRLENRSFQVPLAV